MPHSFVAFVLVAIVMAVLLHRSVFGRYLFAVGKNEEAARYSGIRTQRRGRRRAYIICGALAGLSAVFLAMYTRSISPASHGNFYELYGIAAAVLGGCSLRGGEGSSSASSSARSCCRCCRTSSTSSAFRARSTSPSWAAVILIGVLADQQFGAYRQRALRRREDHARQSVATPATTAQAGRSA